MKRKAQRSDLDLNLDYLSKIKSFSSIIYYTIQKLGVSIICIVLGGGGGDSRNVYFCLAKML